jgi:membrane fusion protein, multidrug efflux system
MKKRMTIMIIALVVVFGGIIGFNFFKGIMIKRFFAKYAPPPVSVSAVTASQKNWQPHLAAVGNFVAMNGVDINSEVSGNVVKIYFDSGQYLEKDSPLIDIGDKSDQATLKFNQAELALRELNYQRQIALFKRGANSSATVDEATASLHQAQANVERTQAQIGSKHIKAPFSGQLGIRQVNLGQYLIPGQTTIVTLQSLDPLYLEFHLPEQMLKSLHINQAIQFRVEEFNDLLFEGKITAINAKIDPNTHNILIQATVPNCPLAALSNLQKTTLIKTRKQIDGDKTIIRCDSQVNQANHITQFAFIPGMFADINVALSPIPNVVVLPSTAISYSLYGNSVFVIEKDKENNALQVKRVFVRTGEQEGNSIIIKKGVEAGQQVVSSGELKLKDGTPVVINNKAQLNDSNVIAQLGQ